MGEKWIEIIDYGILYREIDLVTFDVPLLFVCLDKKKCRKLVLCIDEEQGEYIIANVNAKLLLNLLKNENTMEQVFRDSDEGTMLYVYYDFECSAFRLKSMPVDEVSANMLPDSGAFFELNNRKISEYIDVLENESRIESLYKVISVPYTERLRSFFIVDSDELKTKQTETLQGEIIIKSLKNVFYEKNNIIVNDTEKEVAKDEPITTAVLISCTNDTNLNNCIDCQFIA